ncbi:TPA: tail assembly protein [Raoultella planticola]
MSELVHVQLGGAMARNFGRHWHLKVKNVKQALELIEANRPGFKRWMKNNIKAYDSYHIQITNKDGRKHSLDEAEFKMLAECENIKQIRITPIPRGSGGKAFGWFEAVVGAVILVVSIWFPPLAPLGMALLMAGVQQILSPQAKQPENRKADADSFYFDGPQNTNNQGNPVQLNYGREILVGSQIISSSITIDQISPNEDSKA